ncbi:MAG TPA: hypothetical protein VEC18_00405 [Myxococcota bacterium]|nr:hypothetical protein [Myxococcota bacterium]
MREARRADRRAQPDLGWLAYLAAALISCAPLIVGGFPQGHDWMFEIARVAEFSHAIGERQLPPHWAPNLYGGYGSPVFLFYAPAFSALAAALAGLVGAFATGSAFAIVLLTLVSVLAMRRLFSAIPGLDPQAGRIAAALFALHPYLIGDKLLRNANAEFAALCALPFALDALLRLERRPIVGSALVAAALSASILCHNLTALACLALLLAGGTWLCARRGAARSAAGLVAGVAVGLLIAAFFWLPALALQDAIRIEDLTRGKFDYRQQWKPLALSFGYSEFFGAGALTPLALAFAAWVVVRDRALAARRFLLGLLVASSVCIALQLRASAPIWERLPWLPLMQFPWRLMGPLALLSAVAGAIAVARALEGRSARARVGAELAIFALCVANAWPQLARYRALTEAQAKAIEKAVTPEKLRRGALNASVLDEYLPRGASRSVWKREAIAGGKALLGASPVASTKTLAATGSRIALRVGTEQGTRLRFARWYFPGWEAKLDGAPIAVERSPSGAIDLQIPAPGGVVELRCRAPAARRIGLALSGLGVALWLGLLFAARGRSAAA